MSHTRCTVVSCSADCTDIVDRICTIYTDYSSSSHSDNSDNFIIVVIMMIVPHVVVVGRALAPIVLVVVGFQLLIHVNGQPLKALEPNSRKVV